MYIPVYDVKEFEENRAYIFELWVVAEVLFELEFVEFDLSTTGK